MVYEDYQPETCYYYFDGTLTLYGFTNPCVENDYGEDGCIYQGFAGQYQEYIDYLARTFGFTTSPVFQK